MKKLFLYLTLLSLVFSSAASAVEYVAVLPGKEISLDPSDLVEIVGHNENNNINGYPAINFEGWGSIDLRSASGDYRDDHPSPTKIGMKVIGATKAKAIKCSVTLKITKASEINKVGPTSVLILPENATGNYDLIVESSSDSVTWTPFHSQAVQSDTVKRLFRVRIVHKGQEEVKAKAEKK